MQIGLLLLVLVLYGAALYWLAPIVGIAKLLSVVVLTGFATLALMIISRWRIREHDSAISRQNPDDPVTSLEKQKREA